MKPSKKKAIKILFKKLMEDINEKEEKLNKFRQELFKLANGELEVTVENHKNKQWYLTAKTSNGIGLPYTLVYDFIDK